jgi:hypothetical protein
MVSDTQTFEVEIFAHGDFDPSVDVLRLLGDALEADAQVVDPILTLDTRSRTIEVSLEVRAADETDAVERAMAAVGDAIRSLGLTETWRPRARGETVLEPAPA